MVDTPSWANDEQSQPVTTKKTNTPAWAQDTSTAVAPPNPAKAQTGWDKIKHGQADPDHPNLWNVVYGLHGAMKSASMSGLMSQPVRAVMEGTGYGMDRLKSAYPNQTEGWYKKKLHDMYGEALTSARQDAQKEADDNKFFGDAPAKFIAGAIGSVDPTWVINPVAAGGRLAALRGAGGVAARVGAQAGAHAALGSATDVAAQAMDIVQGQQKDFDIERNLLNASFGGAFGGGAQGIAEGAPVVSKFVKGLFSNRGVDTLPGSTPAGSTSPQTGKSVTLTPEQTTQLRDLIRTGSVDDIKGFLADKQGPKPSWVDVNEIVKHRDSLPENAVQRYKDAIDSHLEATHTKVLNDHFEKEMADWKNKPELEVIRKAEDIADPTVRDSSVASGLNHENTVGFVGPDGKVRVFADAIKTPEQASAVLFHEGLGHYGLAQRFGTGLDKTLETLMNRNVGQFGRAVDDWQKANPGAYNGNRTRAAEEVLAEMSQDGVIKQSVADAISGHVRRFARQMGMKLSYSDAEIQNVLALAHDAVVNGKGRDVGANGFRGMAQPESKSSWGHVENYDDFDDGNAYRGTEGYLPDEDVRQIMSEEEPSVRQNEFRTKGELSESDVARLLDEPEPIPRWATDDVHDFTESDGSLPRSDVEQMETDARFMTPDQLAKQAKNTHEEAFRKFEEGYTPRYRSIETAKEAARNTALDISEFKGRDGVGNLDRKLFVYDNAAKEANDKLVALAQKAEAGPLSADDLADLASTTNDFHYVLGRLDNDLGQVGRALNAAKQITFRRNNIVAMRKALEDEGSPLGPLLDPDNANKFLRQFLSTLMSGGGNPAGAAQMLRSVNRPYWWQYLLSYRNNMMLSGLSTHLKVSMDTATNAGRELEEKLAAIPMGVVRDIARGIGMRNVQQGIHPTEVALHTWGLARAVLDAQTYRDVASAFNNTQAQRFAGSGIQNPRIPFVSKITDAISAQDAFYRSILTSANLYSLGGRRARAQGYTSWDDITTAAAGHARNPTQGMLDDATHLAENTMLTNRSDVNDALDRAKRIRPGMNGGEQLGSFIINYLTPFVRTQSNAVMNQLVRRSPLSFLDHQTRADFAAGGARRDVAIMRTVIGTAIIANAWNAASPENKKLEGAGPQGSVAKLKELEASGWRPNSVHENGRYNVNSNLNLSLNPFDLHNNTASLVAGVREAYDAGNKKDFGLGMKLAFASVMKTLQDQTFISDITEAGSAFDKSGEAGANKMERFAGNQAASFIPNIIRQASKIIDPVARDTSDGFSAQLKANIPGMTNDLPARHSVYGEEQKTGTTLTGVHSWLSQGNGQAEVTDPPMVELARLAKVFKQTLVSPVQKTINVDDTSQFNSDQINDAGHVKLTTEQFQEYQRMAGERIVESMREKMEDPSWSELSDEDKAKWVKKMTSKSKKEVREELYGGN